jgi:hypothetical protein
VDRGNQQCDVTGFEWQRLDNFADARDSCTTAGERKRDVGTNASSSRGVGEIGPAKDRSGIG